MRVKALRREEAALRPKLEDMKRKKRRDRLRRAREDEESKPLMVSINRKSSLHQDIRNKLKDHHSYGFIINGCPRIDAYKISLLI